MRWGGQSLQAASHAMIHEELKGWAAGAGLVAVDRAGNIAMPYDTEGMYRGKASAAGIEVAVYAD